MEIVIKILQFILAFSLLVFIHEFGHFFFAKLFKMRVDKFYLFFNPWFSLLKFKIGETEFGIGWIPFGGYCKIAGMVDESMDTDQLAQEPQPWEFRSKPAWQRLCVMVGGVFMNVVLAFLIYIGLSWSYGRDYVIPSEVTSGYAFNELAHEIGFKDGDIVLGMDGKEAKNALELPKDMALYHPETVEVSRGSARVSIPFGKMRAAEMLQSPDFMTMRIPFVIDSVLVDGPAAGAGILPGDTLVSLNGEPVAFYNEFQDALLEQKNQQVEIGVRRRVADSLAVVTIPLHITDQGKIGVYAAMPLKHMSYTLLQSIPDGFKVTAMQLRDYWQQLKLIFNPKTQAYKSLGGVLSIGNIFPGTWDWYKFWTMTAFLSIVLAVMNILPIPALDGGHVMFVLYEIIMRRKPSEKFLVHAQTVGLILLFALLLYANGNDIYRFFIKGP